MRRACDRRHRQAAAGGRHAPRARDTAGSSRGSAGRRLAALCLTLLFALSLILAASATIAVVTYTPVVHADDGDGSDGDDGGDDDGGDGGDGGDDDEPPRATVSTPSAGMLMMLMIDGRPAGLPQPPPGGSQTGTPEAAQAQGTPPEVAQAQGTPPEVAQAQGTPPEVAQAQGTPPEVAQAQGTPQQASQGTPSGGTVAQEPPGDGAGQQASGPPEAPPGPPGGPPPGTASPQDPPLPGEVQEMARLVAEAPSDPPGADPPPAHPSADGTGDGVAATSVTAVSPEVMLLVVQQELAGRVLYETAAAGSPGQGVPSGSAATVPKYSHLRPREGDGSGATPTVQLDEGQGTPDAGGEQTTPPQMQAALHGWVPGAAVLETWRGALGPSDPAVQQLEQKLAAKPDLMVPMVSLRPAPGSPGTPPAAGTPATMQGDMQAVAMAGTQGGGLAGTTVDGAAGPQVAMIGGTPLAMPEGNPVIVPVNTAELDAAQAATPGEVSPVVPAMEGMEPVFEAAGVPGLVAPGVKGAWLAFEADEPGLAALQPVDELAEMAGLPPAVGVVPEVVYHSVTDEPAAGMVKFGQPLAATFGVPVVLGALPEAAYLGGKEGKEEQAGLALVGPALATAGFSSVAAGLPAVAYWAEQTEMGAGAMAPALIAGELAIPGAGPLLAAGTVVVPGVLQMAADVLPEEIAPPVKFLADTTTDAVKFVGDVVEDALKVTGLDKPVGAMYEGFTDAMAFVGDGLGKVGEGVVEGAAEAGEAVVEGIADAGEAIIEGIGGLFG
jgi:hypothetical protein